MAYKLMIQGTMSSAGKSFIVTALCRIFSEMGYKTAPFKSQNMALNSGVTFDGYEMGRAQIVQAEACKSVPDVRMNPILLKPNSDTGSQVIVMGKSTGNMSAKEYYQYKTELIPVIKEAFSSLEKEYDVIIIEGAGSPAEINLKENDIVNMGLAKMLNVPVLLVGDIDLGGVFAQLLGTLEWLEDDERKLIKGLIINKFRGDVSLLSPGIKMLEKKTGKDVIGVVPYSSAQIDEEDSVTRSFNNREDDTYDIEIYVIRLPHMSNFTDFTPLERVNKVHVRYISDIPEKLADMLIIPGTKNTISDLVWMRKNGLYSYIKEISKSVPIMGICGGYQMLGNKVLDPNHIETVMSYITESGVLEKSETGISGLSLLNTVTTIDEEKTLKRSSGVISEQKGFFKCLNEKKYEGYEIHCGITDMYDGETLNSNDNAFGTYVHGFFDKAEITESLINALRELKHLEPIQEDIADYMDIKDKEYSIAAEALRSSINMKKIMSIMGIENE